MTPRLNPFALASNPMKLLIDFGTKVGQAGLEPSLFELVKIRASQINGCAICLDMHTRDARQHGESEQRIYMLDAWRESPLYSDRERAALAWTDALTKLTEGHAPDEVYRMVEAEFTPEEQVILTLMIVVINGFNRFGVGFRLAPLTDAQRVAA